jgi:hypothetical protein
MDKTQMILMALAVVVLAIIIFRRATGRVKSR